MQRSKMMRKQPPAETCSQAADGPTLKEAPYAPVRATPRHDDPGVALMLRVQRDEPEAFAELVARYWTTLFGRFYRQLGDRQEAEDLAQDVFLRLYRSRQRYRAQAKFTTWLFHIASNVTRNALRTRKRRPCVPLGTLTGPEVESWSTVGKRGGLESPTRPLERAEMAGVVRSAVARLGRRQRQALELFQFHQRSCGEIAHRLHMTPKAARSLLYRARNQLRDCLRVYVET